MKTLTFLKAIKNIIGYFFFIEFIPTKMVRFVQFSTTAVVGNSNLKAATQNQRKRLFTDNRKLFHFWNLTGRKMAPSWSLLARGNKISYNIVIYFNDIYIYIETLWSNIHVVSPKNYIIGLFTLQSTTFWYEIWKIHM